MSFYAENMPRGFANEINTYKFSTRADRDAFCDLIDGSTAITRKEAERNVRYKGDAATKSYNSDLIDGDRYMSGELDYNVYTTF